jgi:hypothetical protein
MAKEQKWFASHPRHHLCQEQILTIDSGALENTTTSTHGSAAVQTESDSISLGPFPLLFLPPDPLPFAASKPFEKIGRM